MKIEINDYKLEKKIKRYLRRFLEGFETPIIDKYTQEEIIDFVILIIENPKLYYSKLWNKLHDKR